MCRLRMSMPMSKYQFFCRKNHHATSSGWVFYCAPFFSNSLLLIVSTSFIKRTTLDSKLWLYTKSLAWKDMNLKIFRQGRKETIDFSILDAHPRGSISIQSIKTFCFEHQSFFVAHMKNKKKWLKNDLKIEKY